MKRFTSRRNFLISIINALVILLTILILAIICLNSCGSSKAMYLSEESTLPTSSSSYLELPSNPSVPDTSIETSKPIDPPSTTPSAPIEPEWRPDRADVEAIAKTLWGECRGVPYISHKAAVVWCILNRVDEGGYYGSSIIEVVSKPNQFTGYDPDYPVDPELVAIAEDVLIRWHAEKEGKTDVGRVLPKGYCFFVGDGNLNYFTNEWRSKNYWDWTLPNPYES